MRTLRWRRIRNWAAMGVIGLSATAAQAFDQQPIRLSNLHEVFSQHDQVLVLGQNCEGLGAEGADGDCSHLADNCDDDCDSIGDWRDNTVFWAGADAFKSLGDTARAGFAPTPFALQNNFGLVSGFNTGFQLGDSALRGQVGASYGFYDIKGRTTIAPGSDDSLEQQTFVTLGVYKRSDINDGDQLSWGVVYDTFVGHQWGWATNEIYLSQIRYIAGYALNECNELGVWGTFQTEDDDAQLDNFAFGGPTTVHAMNQVNSYLRHNWEFGASTMAYIGVVDHADNASWLFGLLADSPLNDRTSLYGNFTYVAPGSATGLVGTSEEAWNVSVGLAFSVGGKAVSPNVSGRRGLPLLPVANNGSFLITD